MRGSLKFKGVSQNIFDLTILDIIHQLRELDQISFDVGTSGIEYMDVISTSYSWAEPDEYDALLMPSLRKILKSIVSDVKKIQEFKNLGATDLDIALIQGDIALIKSMAASNTETNPYSIAKKFRFLDIARDAASPEFDSINLHIGNQYIPLCNLGYCTFETQKPGVTPKTLLVDFQYDGGKTWGPHGASKWHESLSQCFDKSVSFGDGTRFILSSHTLSLLNLQTTASEGLEFALVIIHMHDSREEEGYRGTLYDVIGQFPNIAKTTVYLVQSCYAGKYHAQWKSDAHLIT